MGLDHTVAGTLSVEGIVLDHSVMDTMSQGIRIRKIPVGTLVVEEAHVGCL